MDVKIEKNKKYKTYDYRVEDFKKYKKCDKELLHLVKFNYIVPLSLDILNIFEYKETNYGLLQITNAHWINKDTYKTKNITYQLVSVNKSKFNFVCKENIIDYYNLFLDQTVRKTVSPISDNVFSINWNYDFDNPTINIMELIDVPDIVVAAHQEIRIKTID
jgi:hypothetical protein